VFGFARGDPGFKATGEDADWMGGEELQISTSDTPALANNMDGNGTAIAESGLQQHLEVEVRRRAFGLPSLE
jgi:hypothetical protein